MANLVADAIPPPAKNKPIELWWQDEARVGQPGTLTRLWAQRGTRPPAPRDCRHDWAYLFGAVCPARGVGAALVPPHAKIEAMNLHLAEISRRVASDAHAVVVVDGAGWHKIGRHLIVPDNIRLLVPPPCSPELNPRENVWQHLRQNHLSNRVFDTYDTLVDACCDAWNSLIAMPDRITSIATRSWAETVKVSRRWYKPSPPPPNGADAQTLSQRQRRQHHPVPHHEYRTLKSPEARCFRQTNYLQGGR